MDSRLKLIERLKIDLKGHVFVRKEQREGWKEPAPFYMFKCSKHGYVENYPKGHDKRLECPKCIKEKQDNLRDKLIPKL